MQQTAFAALHVADAPVHGDNVRSLWRWWWGAQRVKWNQHTLDDSFESIFAVSYERKHLEGTT